MDNRAYFLIRPRSKQLNRKIKVSDSERFVVLVNEGNIETICGGLSLEDLGVRLSSQGILSYNSKDFIVERIPGIEANRLTAEYKNKLTNLGDK
ncbi:hypothetical protein HYT23_04910 [Candidatus Pacearchaeota archaeon]|nr:hypothetical protein [Candidatus Pacearchaeota archaeon]